MKKKKSWNRIEYFRKYRELNREAFRIYNKYYNKKWRKENGYHNELNSKKRYPEKEKARRKIRYQIKIGKMKKLPCVKCGNIKSQAHHEDYSKPLKVTWLCAIHHTELHQKLLIRT